MLALLVSMTTFGQSDKTYAERLGFPKGKKYSFSRGRLWNVLFLEPRGLQIHGTRRGHLLFHHDALSLGRELHSLLAKNNPKADAGLHLTLTSEWKDYRWPALSGFQQVPGLSDEDACMYHSVEQVIQHASPEEVEREIRAQIERAKRLGWAPSHIDSHMGTLFAYPPFWSVTSKWASKWAFL